MSIITEAIGSASLYTSRPSISQRLDQTAGISWNPANSPALPEDSDGKLLVREVVQDGDRLMVGWRGAGPMAAEEVPLQHSNRGENR